MRWRVKSPLQNNMRNLFVRLAGADLDILEKCKKTYKTQRIKFTVFATLLFIPPTVGLLSMMYAVSTLTGNIWLIVSVGVVWFFIVLFVDRSIVATFFKSEVEKNSVWTIILRVAFAVVVGVSVSHPITLLWFDESIKQRIEEKKRAAVSERRNQALTEITQIPRGSVSTRVDDKTARRDCLVNLMTLEQSGISRETPCGASSGIKECGSRCENIKKEIEQINEELGSINTQAAAELQRETNDRNNIYTLTNQDIEDIERNYAKDYLARVDALAEIEKDKPHVTWVRWFIFLLFMLLDSLVVLIKLAIPMSEYEDIRDTLLFDAKRTQQAERAAIDAHAESVLPKTLEAKRKYDSKEDELTSLTDVTRRFLIEQEKTSVRADKQFQEIDKRIRRVKDDQLRGSYADYLKGAKNTFNTAWKKAYERFNDFLNSL